MRQCESFVGPMRYFIAPQYTSCSLNIIERSSVKMTAAMVRRTSPAD